MPQILGQFCVTARVSSSHRSSIARARTKWVPRCGSSPEHRRLSGGGLLELTEYHSGTRPGVPNPKDFAADPD